VGRGVATATASGFAHVLMIGGACLRRVVAALMANVVVNGVVAWSGWNENLLCLQIYGASSCAGHDSICSFAETGTDAFRGTMRDSFRSSLLLPPPSSAGPLPSLGIPSSVVGDVARNMLDNKSRDTPCQFCECKRNSFRLMFDKITKRGK